MANLKVDLLNKLANDKMFEEIELIRLAQDPNCNYREKIDYMSLRLSNIAMLNAQLGLVGQYFQDQVPPQQVATEGAPAQPAQPAGVVHPGQTFGE